MPPAVTVLMSVYNAMAYLDQAMASILDQGFTDFEFLVVDDGSSDGSWDRLEHWAARDRRVRLLRNPTNLGLIRSLNRGLDEARAPFIARQDADDVSLPQRLERQMAFLAQHPEVAVVGSGVTLIDEAGRELGFNPKPASDRGVRAMMLVRTAFVHGAVLMRRSVIEGLGLRYDRAMLHTEDYDFLSRLLLAGQGVNLAEPLLLYRLHGESIGSKYTDIQEDMADRIALANFARFGLDSLFSPEEIALLRHGPGRREPLAGRDLLRQYACACRLLDLLANQWRLSPGDLDLMRRQLIDVTAHNLSRQPKAARRWRLLARVLLSRPGPLLAYLRDKRREKRSNQRSARPAA
ncbi:MAG: glycosyltransferase family 2 protein [Thermodesulfobacteriota bacterium]